MESCSSALWHKKNRQKARAFRRISSFFIIFSITFTFLSIPSVRAQKVIETIQVEGASRMIMAPNGEYAYLAGSTYTMGAVHVMSPVDNTVTATIPLPNFYASYTNVELQSTPSGIAITPDSKYLYVTNLKAEYSKAVYKISTATNELIATINGLTFPSSVTITPNGEYAYIITTKFLTGEDSISVLDTATDTIETKIMFSSGLRSVAITPNGEYAYVTSSSGHTVTVIDTATNLITTTITDINYPTGVAIAPNGKYAYVANCLTDSAYGFTSGEVLVIDTTTNTIEATISNLSSPSAIALSLNGAYAYVTNPSQGTISVIDIANRKVISTITDVPTNAITVMPNSKYVYAIGGGTVAVIDTTLTTAIVSPSPSPPPSPTSTATATPTPTPMPTATPTPIPTPYEVPIMGLAFIVIVFLAGVGLLIYLIKRK